MTNAQSKMSTKKSEKKETSEITSGTNATNTINATNIINANILNNKINYESKDFQGEKTEAFRKQGEYGPKKFIKP